MAWLNIQTLHSNTNLIEPHQCFFRLQVFSVFSYKNVVKHLKSAIHEQFSRPLSTPNWTNEFFVVCFTVHEYSHIMVWCPFLWESLASTHLPISCFKPWENLSQWFVSTIKHQFSATKKRIFYMSKNCARSQIFTQYWLTKICYTEKGEFSFAITF